MGSNKSNFWLGLGIGSAIGAILYHCSRTTKAEQFKSKVNNSLHKLTSHAGDMVDTAKEKALDSGTKVADKVADVTFDVAKKANNFKRKVHATALEARK